MTDYLHVVGRFTVPGESDMYIPGEVDEDATRFEEHYDIVPIQPGEDVSEVVANTLLQLRIRHGVSGGEPITITPLYAPVEQPAMADKLTDMLATLDMLKARLPNADFFEEGVLRKAVRNVHGQIAALGALPEE